MRWGFVFGVAALAVGCGRSFTAPKAKQVETVEALTVTPSSIYLAPDDVWHDIAIRGGYPPYSVQRQSDVDAGAGCGVLVTDAGSFDYAACLRPFTNETVTISDSHQQVADLQVSIGAPFEAALQLPSGAQCETIRLVVSGGAPPYHLRGADPTAGACPDGGAAFEPLAGGLTEFLFRAPPWTPDAGNSYALELLDSVEAAQQSPNPLNVYDFAISIDPPSAALPPLQAASPVFVQPGDTAQLEWTPDTRHAHFEMAPDGNSSRGSVERNGLYTAGDNPNTVDHVLVVEDTADGQPGQVADLWVSVGNPMLPAAQVGGGGALFSGDLNGDGIDDLLMANGNSQNNALSFSVIFGGEKPTQQPNLYIPNTLKRLGLGDVTGDGLADLLVAGYQLGGPDSGSGGQQFVPGCGVGPSPSCLADGGSNLGYTTVFCGTWPDGGPWCQANVYDPYGGEVEATTGQLSAGILRFIDSAGDTITCPTQDGGAQFTGLLATCDVGCLDLDGGGHFCSPAFSCGDGGCGSTAAHYNCVHAAADGGWFCSLQTFPQLPSQPVCAENADGSLSCGPYTCVDDHLGGFNCGAQDCRPDVDGVIWCNNTSCLLPASGVPDYGCMTLFDGGYSCQVCPQPTPPDQAPTQSAVTVYAPLPGGGFLNLGLLPGAEYALPAVVAPGQFILGGGYMGQASSQGGMTSFTVDSAHIDFGDAGPNAAPAELRVVHDGSGQPMAIVQATSVYSGQGGNSEPFVLSWFDGASRTVCSAGSGSVPNNNWRGAPLAAVVSLAPGQPETVVATDFDQQRVLLINAGAGCPSVAAESFQALGLDVDAGESPGVLLPLPAAHGFAVQVASQGPLASTWLLELPTAGGGPTVAPVPWATIGLPQIDEDPRVQGMSSGDFNGDGVGDLAVASFDALRFFPGQLGSRFARGEIYKVESPLVSLSSGEVDGGTLVAGLQLLNGQVELFWATHHDDGLNDGSYFSSLAYGELWPSQGDLIGAVLRQGELWTAGIEGGDTLVLGRYADPFDHDGGAIARFAFDGGAQPAQFLAPLLGDRVNPDQAWLALTDAQRQTLYLVGVGAQAGGGLGMQAVQAVPLNGGAVVANGSDLDGGIDFLVLTPSSTLQLGDSRGGLRTLSLPNYLPPCSTDNAAAFVEGGREVVLAGATPVPDGGNSSQTCNSNDHSAEASLFVYDPQTNRLARVAGALTQAKPSSAVRTTNVDGGPELLVGGFGSPGLVALLPAGDGGWYADATYQSQNATLQLAEFPGTDGGARHLRSSLPSYAVEVLTR